MNTAMVLEVFEEMGTVDVGLSVPEAVDLLIEARELGARAKEMESQAKAVLDQQFQETAEDRWEGTKGAVMRSVTSTQRLDTKRFKEEVPEIYKKYLGDPSPAVRYMIK